MMSTAKPQKDKAFCPAPKLAPRQTAASAARAARNATNRNSTVPPSQRQSPSRTSSNTYKAKSPISRNVMKTDSKGDVKANLTSEPAHTNESTLDNFCIPPEQEGDTYAENLPIIIVEENSEVEVKYTDIEQTQQNNEAAFLEIKESEENQNIIFENVDVDQIIDHKPRSRPRTPAICSRPQTPKSLSSRPQTPRMPSRPSTPAHPVRNGNANSRPNTPQRLTTPPRPRTPSLHPLIVPTSSPAHVPTPVFTSNRMHSSLKEEQDIKTAYSTKQKEFQHMKKELDLKQQALFEVFECLRDLREHMSREGITGSGEGFQPQELIVFNVTDWATEEIAQLCRNTVEASATDRAVEIINTSVVIDENRLAELDAKVIDIPARFAELCLQAFTARQELIDWVKELIEKSEYGGGESVERISHYNTQGLELCEALRELKSHADDAVDTVTQLSKRTCRERSALLAVGESLVREVARLRQDLEARITVLNEVQENQTESETTKLLEETRRELEEEKTARIAAKDKLATTESQLRQTRIRVTKMDRQLREAEASIASLTGTVKTLEDQSRQREVQLEARARKLKESLKTGEVASKDLTQQRDALQAEVFDFKEQLEKMTTEHKATIQDLNNQIKYLKNALDELHEKTTLEIKQKEVAEALLAESQNTIEELKTKIAELERSKLNPELPTEREMDLWAELQATKETLHITEEEIAACKREKVRFLETLTKITESDNKVGIQQKLAAELLSKEEIIGKMQTQIRDLTKNIKLNEQKVVQYEQYVRDLQAHNRAVANCQEAPNGISYQDLQQEIMNLRMTLLETAHRKDELSEMLAQKEQQLEQQDKTSRAQARVIKVREELINMLKNKETEQSRELAALQQDLEHRMKIVDEVNKQIAAKADEIQELFATLENKQQQIHRLEKIVLALEEQQRRAQAQRTRHEEKIAALEHELAAGGNRRERKFIFF